MTEDKFEEKTKAMATRVQAAVRNATDAVFAEAEKLDDNNEKFGVLLIATCNLMASTLRAASRQPDWRVSSSTMEQFQLIVVPKLEAVSKRIADRK